MTTAIALCNLHIIEFRLQLSVTTSTIVAIVPAMRADDGINLRFQIVDLLLILFLLLVNRCTVTLVRTNTCTLNLSDKLFALSIHSDVFCTGLQFGLNIKLNDLFFHQNEILAFIFCYIHRQCNHFGSLVLHAECRQRIFVGWTELHNAGQLFTACLNHALAFCSTKLFVELHLRC